MSKKCVNCGQELPDHAKFCNECGADTAEVMTIESISVPSQTSCPVCGQSLDSNSNFCDNCGSPISATANTTTVVTPAVNAQKCNVELAQIKSISKYRGTPMMGYSESTGTLFVYNDRLEFSSKMGNALWARAGVIGLGIAAALGKSTPVEIFEMGQISELREGKYMGVYNTLVVTMKNGETWSFCPALPKSAEPKRIISLLKPYVQNYFE